MTHTIEFVAWWFIWAAVIGAAAGVIGVVWRRVARRRWTDAHVLEAAVAIGLVLSFVGMIIAIVIPD